MTPKVHYMLGHALALGVVLGAVAMLERMDAWWVTGLVLAVAAYAGFLWSYLKWVPARCPACGENRAMRLVESWHGSTPGSPVEYECASCSQVTDTGWTAGDGGG